MSDLSKDEAIRILRGGFDKVLGDVAMDCSAPIFWYHTSGPYAREVIANGTVFFVDAGYGPFAVSALHVVESFRETKVKAQDVSARLETSSSIPADGFLARTLPRIQLH